MSTASAEAKAVDHSSFEEYDAVYQEQEKLLYRRQSAKRIAVIVVSFVVLVLIVLAAVYGMRMGNNDDERPPSLSPSPTGPTKSMLDAMKSVCSVTTYRDLCMSSLASTAKPGTTDPELLFVGSLAASYAVLRNVSGVPAAFAAVNINDSRIVKALHDCEDLLADSVKQVNASLLATTTNKQTPPAAPILTEAKVKDLRTWLSAALTNIETCFDGLDSNRELRQRIESTLCNSIQLTSNSLAIITNIFGILDDFKRPLHRRRLLGVNPSIGKKNRKISSNPLSFGPQV